MFESHSHSMSWLTARNSGADDAAAALLHIPAMPPPPGLISDFEKRPSNHLLISVVNALFTALAVVFLGIRVSTRRVLPRGQRLGWDDGCSVLALASSVAHAGLVYHALDIGFGRHLWDTPAVTVQQKASFYSILAYIYATTIFLVKLSILLLYQRLFAVSTLSRRLIVAGYVAVAFMWAGTIATTTAGNRVCTTVQKSLSEPFCSATNLNINILTIAALNAAVDFYVLGVPLPRIVRLRVSPRQKLGVLVIFLAGLVACLMSVARLAIVASTLHSQDILWNAAWVTAFSIVEMNLGIVCSCMMFTPTLYQQVRSAMRSLRLSVGWNNRNAISEEKQGNCGLSGDSRKEEVGGGRVDAVEGQPWEAMPDLEQLT